MKLQHLPPRVLTLVFPPQKRYSVASLDLTPTQDTQPSHLNPIQPPSEPKPLLAKSIPQSPTSTIPSSHPTNSYPTHTLFHSPASPPPLKSTPHPIRLNKNNFRQRKRHREFLWSVSKSALNLQSKQLYVLVPYYYCLRLVLGVLLMR